MNNLRTLPAVLTVFIAVASIVESCGPDQAAVASGGSDAATTIAGSGGSDAATTIAGSGDATTTTTIDPSQTTTTSPGTLTTTTEADSNFEDLINGQFIINNGGGGGGGGGAISNNTLGISDELLAALNKEGLQPISLTQYFYFRND